ncbi:MAG: transcription elongation factor Spt5 [Candidatus Hadarchaeales archaeon]
MEVPRVRIYAVKTTIGQERATADMIYARARSKGIKEFISVVVPHGLRGYVFVEVEGDHTVVEKLRSGIKHAKSVVRKEVALREIEPFISPGPPPIKVSAGDLVELTTGPLKGNRAKVIRVDEAKEEVTIELIEATFPIPVTVKVDMIKVIEKK